MSYYTGDFYQGDPGFFSFLGKVGKAALGFLPGGKAATSVASVAGGVLNRAKATRAGQMVLQHPTISAAGSAGLLGAGTGLATGRKMGGTPAAAGGGARMARMRAAGIGRRHRRMRVTNVKALRRAIRRARGFEKLARKVMHFTSPRKAHGRAVFRVRRRK